MKTKTTKTEASKIKTAAKNTVATKTEPTLLAPGGLPTSESNPTSGRLSIPPTPLHRSS
jgi:hypothetical protein